MKNIKKIYHNPNLEDKELIFELENGMKIIKHSDTTVNKFNIKRWEEVDFVPQNYKPLSRKPSAKEIKTLKNFLKKRESTKKGPLAKIKQLFFNLKTKICRYRQKIFSRFHED